MPVQPVERKLAAIFVADIVGYSRLMSLDEVGTIARLKAARRVVDALIAEHRGRIFHTAGDNVMADFASPVSAVQCAMAVQDVIAAEGAKDSANDPMQFRIGIHLGDVIVDGDNLLGDGVNIAARLEALAEPGAIWISGAVREQIGTRLPVTMTDLGEQQVKNIDQPIHAFRIGPALTHTVASAPGRREPGEGNSALPLPDKPSIAVLPFQNLSGDPEQEYFADGMVEDITTALSKLRWFFVIARNSAFAYKGRAVDVKQVGRELGVRYILEGSVRRGGNRLRITAQLVDAATGNHVWAERYDRDLADIFAVQDEITERVVAAIEPELYAAEHIRSQRKPPESLDAWECVTRALAYVGQSTREGDTEAEALCRRTIAIAPDYGQAHSLLAWALLRKTFWSSDLSTVLPEVNAELELALNLDDRDPWAHFVMGVSFVRQRRFDNSVRALRHALELNPNFAAAHALLGGPLALRGAHDEGITSAEHALRLSPNDRLVAAYAARSLMIAHFVAGRYAESGFWARASIEKGVGQLPGYVFHIAALARQGDLGRAIEARETLLRLWPNFSLAWMAETLPMIGELAERLRESLREAGVPEE